MRVLIADDDPIVQALVRTVLEELGHEVETVADGALALARQAEAPAPLLVLDVDMPGVDGLEVCRRIRAATGTQPFVICFTARTGAMELRAVLDAGADDYVAKPAAPETLRARFEIAVRRIALDTAHRAAMAELARSRWLAGIGETTLALEHEINNPLSALLGEAELLLMEDGMDATQREALEVICEQGRRIADVVRRLQRLKHQHVTARTVEYVDGARMLDLGRRD